jgi:hypothetical protein
MPGNLEEDEGLNWVMNPCVINRFSMELTRANDEKRNVEERQPRHNCQQRKMRELRD